MNGDDTQEVKNFCQHGDDQHTVYCTTFRYYSCLSDEGDGQ